MLLSAVKKKLSEDIPPLGDRHTICSWFREEEPEPAPMIDMVGYQKMLNVLPDHIVSSLEKARDERAGRGPMLRAGLGYEELLSSVIVDGTTVGNSSTENFLFPAQLFPSNYLQPGGIPGRSIHFKARGRHTTLTTAATLIFKFGAALTNVIPTTTWCVSGAFSNGYDHSDRNTVVLRRYGRGSLCGKCWYGICPGRLYC